MAPDGRQRPRSIEQAPRVAWDNVAEPVALRPRPASRHLPGQPRSRPV